MLLNYTIFFIYFITGIRASSRLLTPMVPSEAYTYSLTIDQTQPDLIKMFWKIINNNEIQIELHAQTTGYISFGLSPDGGMPNSDMVFGWVDQFGAKLIDAYSIRKLSPTKDAQQDWSLLEAREINGYTIIKGKRKLDTGDSNDRAITNEATWLIFAWNNQDPIGENWTYHGQNKRAIFTSLI